MRIAMITHFPEDLANPRGGVATAAVALLRGLSRFDDLDLHVLSFMANRTDSYPVDDPRCTVHPMPPDSRLPGFLANVTVRRRRIARVVEQLKPDVVHAQGWACFTDPKRWPTVLTVHGIQELNVLYSDRGLRRVRSWFTRVAERHYRRLYKHVICIADYVEMQLAGQLPGRHYHIPNAVDHAFFDTPRCPVPGRTVYVGLIVPGKNIGGLVEVAGRVREAVPDFSFHLVGPVDSEAYLRQQQRRCRELGIENHVKFVGQLSRQETRQELAAASCMIFASFQETLPVAIAEAMAMGLPVVSSAVAGIPEMIDDGQTGFLVHTGRPEDLAERVVRVLRDRELADRLSRGAKKKAEAYHPVHVAEQTLDVYRRVLDEWQGCRRLGEVTP